MQLKSIGVWWRRRLAAVEKESGAESGCFDISVDSGPHGSFTMVLGVSDVLLAAVAVFALGGPEWPLSHVLCQDSCRCELSALFTCCCRENWHATLGVVLVDRLVMVGRVAPCIWPAYRSVSGAIAKC